MSYKEETIKYKNKKQDHTFLEEEENFYKKKKKKKNKRADHKHEYIPVIVHDDTWCRFTIFDYGFVCKYCGRIKNICFNWGHNLDKFNQFKKEHPDFIEIELPENWDWIKDKYLPIK